jgi:chromosome partitioning protein
MFKRGLTVMNDPARMTMLAPMPGSAAETRSAHVIVVGNEKGGAGKSTVAMHLIVALLRMGKRVGAIDLDLRQRTLSRYVENRVQWCAQRGQALPMPQIADVRGSIARDLDLAESEEAALFASAVRRLSETCHFIVVDAPGADSFLSREAHACADTLITPMNDSFIDFDLLGDIDPATHQVVRPSFYAELVWDSRKRKAQAQRRPIDWVVMRNRMAAGRIEARNKVRMTDALQTLSGRVGFRLAPGFSERVIFRELFPQGLTLLDVDNGGREEMRMAHVAARQEVRDLLIVLKLPGLEGAPLQF